jgi:hypothetical protein
LKLLNGAAEGKAAATPSAKEKLASEKETVMKALEGIDALNSSKKAASGSPMKKNKNPVEDKTSVGHIFNQLKRGAKKKEQSKRIRRRRGVYLRRLKWKKTEEE